MAELGNLIQWLKEIQILGNSWYKPTAEWKELERQLDQLQKKLEIWEAECTNRGQSSDATLNDTLQDFKLVVEVELTNLKKRDSQKCCWSGCWPWLTLSTTLFPDQLRVSIQGAIDAVNNIPEVPRLTEEAGVEVARLVQQESSSEPITVDSRYVPFKDSEKQVYEALVNPKGPPVVVLHGGPGKGKTTLARNTATFYESKSDQLGFDHVFFLACGPQARAEETQFELIQRFSFEPSDIPQEDDMTRSIRIGRQIKAFLSTRKVLIILDDVSDGKFVESILNLCCDRVKCLVTSQEATLCLCLDPSKFHKIQIQDLDMESAGKILASHVGLPNQQIPAHVQEVAETMIRKTDFNPLAVASLANQIGPERANELVEWEEASSNLFQALHSEDHAVSPGMFPRSFWSTTKLCMDKLTEDSRKLLLLIHACEGPSIPEEVVEVLYKGLLSQGESRTFPHSARDELVHRQLVKITTVEARVSSGKVNVNKQRNWSVHSLHRLYIEKEMSQARDSLIASLIGGDRSNEGARIDSQREIVSETEEVIDTTILTTLCALYLDKPLASMAGRELCVPAENFSNIRRNAIEPITLLLAQPRSPRWTETEHRCAAKVFMSYISNGTLDDLSILHLLEVEIATDAMCIVLRDFATIEETCLLNENTQKLIEVLMNQFAKDINPSLQQHTTTALANLAWGPDHMKDKIVNHLGMLSRLVNLLSKDVNPSLQQHVARALANLACGGYEIKDKIVNHVGVLLELVNSLSKDTNPILQQQAARALTNLAHGGLQIKDKIVNHPGVLMELFNSLSKDVNPLLQQQVAKVFTNLACGCRVIKDKIVNHPGVLLELVNSLSKKINPGLQQQAAKALANLACGGHETKDKIVNHPGILSELANMLSKDMNPSLQERVVRVFINLAGDRMDDTSRVQIGKHPGLIAELVKSLSKESNFVLQEKAAWALCNLAHAKGNITRMKVRDGIIEGLVGLLSRTTQWRAAFVLTLIDPQGENEEHLQSASAYEGKAMASYWLGLFKEAIVICNKGRELGFHGWLWDNLSVSCALKAKAGDYQAAMVDANEAVNSKDIDRPGFHLQERGMLKMMMGDFHGALADLNKGLAIDVDDYEMLKQRGYVKFLLEDEEGARADAELALRVKPSRVDDIYYGLGPCLGTGSVEYLGYKLR